MKCLWLSILFTAVFAPAAKPAEYNVQISPVNAKIQWQLGGTPHGARGTFQLKKGDIWFDPETGKMRGELIVDAASGESGNGLRDGRMRSGVLEVKQYPEIVFRPDRFEGKIDLQGSCEVNMHGRFNIHGQDHEITVPAKLTFQRDVVIAILRFSVPYVEWGMKDPGSLILRVEKVVTIEVKAEGHMGKGL